MDDDEFKRMLGSVKRTNPVCFELPGEPPASRDEVSNAEASLERQLKANTVKRRSYSHFNQGAFYYQWMATMPADTFATLVDKFSEKLRSHAVFREAFGVI